MNLHNVGLIAKREFIANVRTKAFWISALSVPVVAVVGGAMAAFVADIRSVESYAVVDQSGWVHDATRRHVIASDVDAALNAIASAPALPREGETGALLDEVANVIDDPSEREAFRARAIDLIFTLRTESGRIRAPATAAERFADWWVTKPDAVAGEFADVSLAAYREVEPQRLDAAHLNALVDDGSLRGYFVIPDDPVRTSEGARYVSGSLTDQGISRWYGRQVSEVVQAQRLREESIDPDTAEWLREPVTFEVAKPAGAGAESAEDVDYIAEWAPAGLVYLLWLSIFTTNQILLASTIEEKAGKLAELLLASVSPAELMAGKVAGIGAAGFSAILAWVALALIGLGGVASAGTLPVGPLLQPALLIGLPVYFLLGYLFYASLYCAVGALCNTIQETQSLATPLVFITFLPLFLVFPVTRDPSGAVAVAASWIPPLTPFVMLNRMADPPSILTLVGTTALMVVSVWYMLRLGGRIFENGILRTGKPPSLRQLPSLLRG